MSHSGKNSILYQMIQQFGTQNKQKGRMVFNADTNTLLSADDPRAVKTTTETVSNSRLEYVYETKEYEELLRGQKHFIVVKNEDVKRYDNIIIYETKNFIRTGRYEIKQIVQVEKSKDNPGLKEGYSVIGWE